MITVWVIILLIVLILIIPIKFEYINNSNNGVSINLYLVKLFNIKIKIKRKKNEKNVIEKIKSFYNSIKKYNDNKRKYRLLLRMCYLENISIEYKVKDIYSYVFLNGLIEYIDYEVLEMFNTIDEKSYDLKLGNKNEGFHKIVIYFRLSYVLFLLINNIRILSVIRVNKKKGDVLGTINQ